MRIDIITATLTEIERAADALVESAERMPNEIKRIRAAHSDRKEILAVVAELREHLADGDGDVAGMVDLAERLKTIAREWGDDTLERRLMAAIGGSIQ